MKATPTYDAMVKRHMVGVPIEQFTFRNSSLVDATLNTFKLNIKNSLPVLTTECSNCLTPKPNLYVSTAKPFHSDMVRPKYNSTTMMLATTTVKPSVKEVGAWCSFGKRGSNNLWQFLRMHRTTGTQYMKSV